MVIVQAPLAPVDLHCDLHRRARALWPTGGRKALGGAGAVLIVAGAVLRAGAAFVPDAASALLGLAGLCWVAAFGLLCWRIAPVLWRVRPDGLWGCQG